jgi:hypothetical protein
VMPITSATSMAKLLGYLGMDVNAMTLNDWQGVLLTLLAAAAMIFIYFLVFNPKNKDVLEDQRNVPFEDEHTDMGEKK